MMGGNPAPARASAKPPPLGSIPDPSKSEEARTTPLPDLPARQWARLPSIDPAACSSSDSFTIATYNVMADIWSPPYNYPHLAPWAVTWAYRGRLIVKEMDQLKPDVLCMQELGKDAEQSFTPQMTERGYASLFKPNPSGEGCAIYWKKDRFDLVDSRLADYNTLAKKRVEADTCGGELQKKLCTSMFSLSHHNVYALALLKEKRSNRLALVISTHLYWGGAPDWNKQVQIMQAALLFDELADMYSQDPLPSIFFCGDFNSRPPPDETGLYVFLHKGTVPKDNIVWTMNGARKDLADISPAPTHKLASRVTLVSSYSLLGKEPPFTHSARGFAAPIDFIYCTPATVKVLEVLNVFDAKEMPYGLPTLHYGADHVCMCTRFMFANP